jgi:hypothetical protein
MTSKKHNTGNNNNHFVEINKSLNKLSLTNQPAAASQPHQMQPAKQQQPASHAASCRQPYIINWLIVAFQLYFGGILL